MWYNKYLWPHISPPLPPLWKVLSHILATHQTSIRWNRRRKSEDGKAEGGEETLKRFIQCVKNKTNKWHQVQLIDF